MTKRLILVVLCAVLGAAVLAGAARAGLLRPESIAALAPGPGLLAGDPVNLGGGCFLSALANGPLREAGVLEFDPEYGTRLGDTTVAWPHGYMARPNGDQLDVLTPQGNVIATTGSEYRIFGGWVEWPFVNGSVWWACGAVEPLDD